MTPDPSLISTKRNKLILKDRDGESSNETNPPQTCLTKKHHTDQMKKLFDLLKNTTSSKEIIALSNLDDLIRSSVSNTKDYIPNEKEQ